MDTHYPFRLVTRALLFVMLGLAGCSEPPATSADSNSVTPTTQQTGLDGPPLGQLGERVVPTHYRLDLTIEPSEPEFSGKVAIDITLNEPTDVIYLHGRDLVVNRTWLEIAGKTVTATYNQVDATGVAEVRLGDRVDVGAATLHFDYSAPFNAALEGLYRVEEGGDDYAFTQFEATSARLAFPCFDEPAFKTPFDIALTTNSTYEVITTTPELSRTPVGAQSNRRIYATTAPLPTYLIAFAVGPLDVVDWPALPPTEIRDRPLPLRGVAARGKGGDLNYALDNTRSLVEALEEYFDSPFPYPKLDIIAVPDFAAGAMENVGAITYREQLLLLPATASVQQKRAYASVHSHELAHQWFGNLVTPRWWDDIWLNESFATWMGNKAVDRVQPGQGFTNSTLRGALGAMSSDSLVSARQIRQPIESNHDIATAFDGITYRKGGGVLQMFESYLGEDTFRAGVRLHMRRFANKVADADDFMRSLADAAERPDVIEAFRSFLYQPGVPFMRAAVNCSEATVSVDLVQNRYLPIGSTGSRDQTWHIPMCLSYQTTTGRAKHCELVNELQASITLPTEQCPQWVMPNADGAGYYRWSLDESGWASLFSHFDQLNEREAQSALNSLAAGYNANEVTTQTITQAIDIMAAQPSREVATGPIRTLAFIHERLATDPVAKAGVEAYVREAYVARLARLGLTANTVADAENPTETTLLRSSLVGVMANIGKDEALRATLTAQAIDYLAFDAESPGLNPAAINPNLVGIALGVAVEQRDAEFAKQLLDAALVSRDAVFRQRALSALAGAKDDSIALMMRNMILDERLRNNEATLVAFGQSRVKEQRTALWRWVQDNMTALVARIPTWRQGAVTRVGDGFCTAQRADELQDYFGERISGLEGGPRNLAQTAERVRLCAALVDAKEDEVNAFFKDRTDGHTHPHPHQ